MVLVLPPIVIVGAGDVLIPFASVNVAVNVTESPLLPAVFPPVVLTTTVGGVLSTFTVEVAPVDTVVWLPARSVTVTEYAAAPSLGGIVIITVPVAATPLVTLTAEFVLPASVTLAVPLKCGSVAVNVRES